MSSQVAILILATLLLGGCLSGCAHSLGYAGQHPGRFTCRGKVAITVAVAGQINAAYSAGNIGSISANGDCGQEFTLEQGLPVAPETGK